MHFDTWAGMRNKRLDFHVEATFMRIAKRTDPVVRLRGKREAEFRAFSKAITNPNHTDIEILREISPYLEGHDGEESLVHYLHHNPDGIALLKGASAVKNQIEYYLAVPPEPPVLDFLHRHKGVIGIGGATFAGAGAFLAASLPRAASDPLGTVAHSVLMLVAGGMVTGGTVATLSTGIVGIPGITMEGRTALEVSAGPLLRLRALFERETGETSRGRYPPTQSKRVSRDP